MPKFIPVAPVRCRRGTFAIATLSSPVRQEGALMGKCLRRLYHLSDVLRLSFALLSLRQNKVLRIFLDHRASEKRRKLWSLMGLRLSPSASRGSVGRVVQNNCSKKRGNLIIKAAKKKAFHFYVKVFLSIAPLEIRFFLLRFFIGQSSDVFEVSPGRDGLH